jgi:hypothetical protein
MRSNPAFEIEVISQPISKPYRLDKLQTTI